MKVNDLLTDIGSVLQEDYTTSPVWTKAEVFGHLRQTLREFCALTQIVDKCEVRLVNGTTGEADVPTDFDNLYFTQFNELAVDIVNLGDLDFVSGTWSLGTTGVPLASTIMGSGDSAVVRYIPVPTTVETAGSAPPVAAPLILDSGAGSWEVTCASGILITNASAGGVASIVLAGPATYWDLTINAAGVLSATASASVVPTTLNLQDVGGGSLVWSITISDLGVLTSTAAYGYYGLAVSALLNDTDYQDFIAGGGASAEYGVVVDGYAYGSATTPTNVLRLNSSIGTTMYALTAANSSMLWYKGTVRDLVTYDSEVWLSDGLIPILKHGTLALAYASDGDGQDLNKAKLLRAVFLAECNSIKQMFQSRLA